MSSHNYDIVYGPSRLGMYGIRHWIIDEMEQTHIVRWPDGSYYWYKTGTLHREDGPAVEHLDGIKQWYLNDIRLSEEQFNVYLANQATNQAILAQSDNRIPTDLLNELT